MKVKLIQFADGLFLEFEKKGPALSFLPRSAVLGRDEVFSLEQEVCVGQWISQCQGGLGSLTYRSGIKK